MREQHHDVLDKLTAISREDRDVDGDFRSRIEVRHDDWLERLPYARADLLQSSKPTSALSLVCWIRAYLSPLLRFMPPLWAHGTTPTSTLMTARSALLDDRVFGSLGP